MLTLPKSWRDGEYLTAEKMNQQIDQNFEWIRNRNINTVLVRNGISDWAQSSIDTWQAVDASVLFVTLTTNGGDVLLNANLAYANSGAAGGTLLDWLVQPYGQTAFYLSSLSSIPLTDGMFAEQLGSGFVNRNNHSFLWTNVPANSYKFTLYWYSTVGLNTINYTNSIVQLSAEEYGVWTP